MEKLSCAHTSIPQFLYTTYNVIQNVQRNHSSPLIRGLQLSINKRAKKEGVASHLRMVVLVNMTVGWPRHSSRTVQNLVWRGVSSCRNLPCRNGHHGVVAR